MIVLVCGGRRFGQTVRLEQALENLLFVQRKPPTELKIVNGGQRGADKLSTNWAQKNGIDYKEYPVDHSLDGPWPGAGPHRNQRMLDNEPVDMVIAFPGGDGTANMIKLARAAGVKKIVDMREMK